MGKQSYLVNTSRCDIVDNSYLCKLLTEKMISGFATDVVDNNDEYGFRRLDNVILTPHIGSHTQNVMKKLVQCATNDCVGYLENIH